jgi:sigma-54 dependent transcriptional regulator, acetoin dehydrogenase operon transcriptional activator AcoR
MSNILFLALEDATLSLIAGGYAKKIAPIGTTISCSASQNNTEIPLNVSHDDDFSMPDNLIELQEIADQYFDVIIVCHNGTTAPEPFPGNPPLIYWNLPSITELPNNAPKQALCERIKQLVSVFFLNGYYAAFNSTINNYKMVLDHISDAIIAHDFNRRIYYFNHAAEKLTGYKQEDVINRDCHEIFGDGLCGSECLFCSPDSSSAEHHDCQRTIQLTDRNGKKRLCDMNISTLTDAGIPVGVLATIRKLQSDNEQFDQSKNEVFPGIIGASNELSEIFNSIRDVATSTASTLIYGESGTGKELAARAIHNLSLRKDKLFVPINCGALPENLLESELFGHVRGAFTGAIRDKKGRFELADGGTIFLDEIGDISLPMQVKLLRVLQEGTFERLGGETTVKIDVRVVSATNKNLETEIKTGRFREDLYYRLGVVPLTLPPLRKRGRDVLMLAEFFINHGTKKDNRQTISLSNEVNEIFLNYGWPGNIRELQNWIQYALLKCKGNLIEPVHLPEFSRTTVNITLPQQITKKQRRKKLDFNRVNQALKETGGNKAKAAKLLNVGRATLYRFIDDRRSSDA